MNKSPNILIVTKDLSSRGGVSNYFRLFFRAYDEDVLSVGAAIIGSRPKDYLLRTKRKMAYLFEYLSDLWKIGSLLKNDKAIKIVQVNPSLIPVPLIRDGIIMIVAFCMKRRVIVFFRGWSDEGVNAIERYAVIKNLFRKIYSQANRVIVLADRFIPKLLEWGIDRDKIRVSKTMFDGKKIPIFYKRSAPNLHFLFLGRISKDKGCFEIVKAASILKTAGLKFRIDFYGHGTEEIVLYQLKQRISKLNLASVCYLHDYAEEDKRFEIYDDADAFLLPSYHEGCPNSVLEAMACGLFVICTDVGALKEVVQDNINGKIVKVRDAMDLADKMRWAIENVENIRALGEKNRDYAFENFESKIIINQMKDIYKGLLSEIK